MFCHLFIAGRCHNSPTLFFAHSLHTNIHICRSREEVRRENMLIKISAGRRCTGDTRHRSSYSLRMASVCDSSGDMSPPSEDCESLAWIMKESLSSSASRSGDVEEELELDTLEARCCRRDRSILNRLSLFSSGRAVDAELGGNRDMVAAGWWWC